MTLELPPSPVEKVAGEIETAIDEAVEEIKDALPDPSAIDFDKLADVIAEKAADKVYDKMKVLVGDLIEAVEDAATIAEATVETPPAATEETPAAETEPEETEPDVKPKTGHKLFKRPLKKDSN